MHAQVETTTATITETTATLEISFGNEQPIVTVPYSSLRRSPLNARTKPLSGIPGLAANIRAKGLLQNLVVHEMKGARGKQRRYGVCAGQRREAALDLLHEQKHIAADYPVPVRIVSEGEALAISLIENSEREGLDPFDVLRSYRMLAEEGRSVDYIAALFSASPLTVKRRMKLANVSPKLLGLLREDGITLDQLAALALADDHETQELIWSEANEWQRQPNYLRQAITRAEIDASHSRLVRFVGLAAYEAAGGYVRRDLFSDDENAGFIADAELLQRLAGEKLDAVAEEIRAEGWNWTETRIERDVLELNRYDRLAPINRPYTGNEQREMDTLTARQDELAEQYDALLEDDENAYEEGERIETELNSVTAAIQALEARALIWDTQQMAEAGAFIILDPQGNLITERGLIRRDGNSTHDTAATTVGQAVAALKEVNRRAKPVHSAKLCQRLTAHRTAAIHAELIAQPSVALAALLFRLVPVAFPERYGVGPGRDYLELHATSNHSALLKVADDLSTSTAWGVIDARRQQWLAALPRNLADLLPWLTGQDPGTTLLDLLAFCTGTLLDGVTDTEGPHAINALSNVLQLDMARYWTPTRATYFDHVSKSRIVDVAMQAVSPKVALDLSKMKKGDASATVEMRLAQSDWLPDILTDREVPPVRALGVRSTRDDETDEDEANTGEAEAQPDAESDGESVAAWPYPTAANMANAETTQSTA
jgi:ParB family transcriptional regulator, chromosome partitioning protein